QRQDLEKCGWLVRLLPELADTMVVPAPVWQLAPEQERRLMFQALSRFLINIGGTSGTLLLLDDLQCAGEDTFDLLATLVESGSGDTLRIVAAHRETEVGPSHPLAMSIAAWAQKHVAAKLHLDPLEADESAELAGYLLGDDGAPSSAAAQVLARGGG